MWLLAKFHQRYPGLYHKWGRGWKGTTDGTIPYRLYLMMLSTTDPMEATDELSAVRSTALGIALALNGDDSKVGHAIKGLVRRAYPERTD